MRVRPLIIGAIATAFGVTTWVMVTGEGDPGPTFTAPRYDSLQALADRLNELGYGCDHLIASPVNDTADERSAAGSCVWESRPIDLSMFPDADAQKRFAKRGRPFACGGSEDVHYVNGNLWIVELVSPRPTERDPAFTRRIAADLNATVVTIDCS